ncbi:cation:proton antiporter [Streptomyces collinus]|uniref:cation:proton antiporter domain-containing protein n=1 Tax=Streptomyces collinus TaxID=42684 RepID=UPI0029420461|nr:cation:proton antiporter [Streptomyces collinus]
MTGGAAGATGPLDPTAAFLLGLSALLFLTYGAGRAARAAGLPPVVAEMAVGLLAGPSLLGALAPGAHRLLFGPGTLPALDTLAQLGVTLYALGIGRRLGWAEELPDGTRVPRGAEGRGEGALGPEGRGWGALGCMALADAAPGQGARGDAARADAARAQEARGDAARGQGARGDAARGQGARGDAARGQGAPGQGARGEGARGDGTRADEARAQEARGEAARGEGTRADGTRGQGAPGRAARGQGARGDKALGQGARGDGAWDGTVLVLAVVSFGVPMVAGVLLAFGPVGRFAGPRTGTAGFALFLGCALSVTALPVLARLLEAAGLTRTRVGRLSLGAAAAGDAAAWCTLTAALVASGAVRPGRLLLAGCGLAAVAVLWWASRGRRARRPGAGLVLPVAGGVLAGGASAALGLHQLFGALLFGFLYGRLRPGPAPGLDMLEQVAAAVLLPCFFLGYGQRLDLGAFGWSGTTLAVVGAVVAVACVVKTAGCAAVGALRGLPAAEWLRLGILMNSRGLTELVVLSVGYQAGLIDRTLLLALTLMALLTTALVGPCLALLDRLRPLDAPEAPAGDGVADRVRVEASPAR